MAHNTIENQMALSHVEFLLLRYPVYRLSPKTGMVAGYLFNKTIGGRAIMKSTWTIIFLIFLLWYCVDKALTVTTSNTIQKMEVTQCR